MIHKLSKSEALEAIKNYTNIVTSKDAERLKIIAENLDDDGSINYQKVLELAYKNAAKPASSLRKSKSDIAKIAKKNGITLLMKTDDAKINTNKKLWFEGKLLIKEKAQKYQLETIKQPDINIDNIATEIENPKTKIKYFISYAHKDDVLVQQFLALFRTHNNRKKYEFIEWNDGHIIVGGNKGWHTEIQNAIKECDFGLLLLSATYFNREYIKNKELNKFITKDQNGEIIVKKSMFPIGLEQFSFKMDMLGLEQQQIYLYQTKPGEKKKFFNEFKEPNLTRFIIDCVDELERKLSIEPIIPPKKNTPNTVETTIDKVHSQKFNLEHGETQKNIKNLASKTDLSKSKSNTKDKTTVSELINKWLHQEKKSLFAVLGQFGIGKTFSLQKFTVEQLNKIKQNNTGYFPLYFDLRKFEMKVLDKIGFTVWDIIASILGRNNTLKDENPLTAKDVKSIWNNHKTLIIFDGLDEVLPHIADAKMDSHFLEELFKLIPNFKSKTNKDPKDPKQKMILSCRTDYFKSITEQYSFFQNQNREHIDGDKDFSACFLLPFNENQILTYLEKTFPDKNKETLYKTLKDVHNLIELASRPVFLDFIVEIFDKIEELQLKKGIVTTANLYDLIIDKSFDRDEGKHEISTSIKKILLQEIAAFLWKRSTKRIAFEKLETFLGEKLANGNAEMKKIWLQKESENLYKDLRNASFLTRSGEKDFGFSHTSIQEYFLAKYIVNSITKQQWQNLELKSVSTETIDFVMDLLQIMDADDKQTFDNSWKIAFKKTQQEKTKLLLTIYIKDIKTKHLLLKPEPFNLSGINLHKTHLQGTETNYLDFSDAIFKNAHFRNSTFNYINFDNANLNNADLSNTILTNISMQNTKLKNSILCGTMRNIYAKDVNIKNADLQYTKILKSVWQPKNKAKTKATIIKQTPQTKESILAEIAGHTSAVLSCSFSPDGKKALSASDDGTMKYWNLETKKEILNFSHYKNQAVAIIENKKVVFMKGKEIWRYLEWKTKDKYGKTVYKPYDAYEELLE